MSQKSKSHFFKKETEQEFNLSHLGPPPGHQETPWQDKTEKTSNKNTGELIFPDRPSNKICTHKTVMSTPIYICDHPNQSDRVLRIISRGTPVVILSKKVDPWFQIETTDGPYFKGFVLSSFLKKEKDKDKDG